MPDCCICSESLELFGIGQCGHKDICARCHFKLRTKQNKMECSVCNQINEQVIIADDLHRKFNDFDLEDCIEFEEGELFFPTEMIKRRFELHICNKCPFPECEEQGVAFKDYLQYKKHLTTRHKKYLW